MQYRRFLELSEEFGAFVVSLHTLYLDGVVGFGVLHGRLLEHQHQTKLCLGECEEASGDFQDRWVINYKHLCGEDYNVESVSPFMTQGGVKQRTRRNGADHILMGRACVVFLFDYWENYLRGEVRTAYEVLDSAGDPTKCDLWGDMHLMRNAIVHEKGVAKNRFKEMKVFTWFRPGDQIDLDFAKVKEMFARMADFRNHLHALSLVPHDARFPSRD